MAINARNRGEILAELRRLYVAMEITHRQMVEAEEAVPFCRERLRQAVCKDGDAVAAVVNFEIAHGIDEETSDAMHEEIGMMENPA